jgi:hypothetical protein
MQMKHEVFLGVCNIMHDIYPQGVTTWLKALQDPNIRSGHSMRMKSYRPGCWKKVFSCQRKSDAGMPVCSLTYASQLQQFTPGTQL